MQLDEKKREELLLHPSFILNLPRRLAEKIEKNSLKDPIFLQFVPLRLEETLAPPHFTSDPVQEHAFRLKPKLLQKYEGRSLLVTTSACAMHCRYCFRREFDYEKKSKGFEEELEALRNDETIEEIILSGGDPLTLSNESLQALIEACEKIPHLKRLRFHTRFPIGIPERIDAGFLRLLESCKLQVIFVIHCNHSQELDEEIFAALKKIQKCGIPILNQSVLLKGINDTILEQKRLLEALTGHGILPYYLHQLDQVVGASHFEVDEKVGREIVENLRTSLPGYAVPAYVKEIAGEKSKTLLPLITTTELIENTEGG